MIDSTLLMLGLMLLLVLVLVMIRIEVAFALGVIGILWALVEGLSLTFAISRLFGGMDIFVLLAVPFFLLAGELMNQAGITKKLFDIANAIVGRFRGGLAQANITASLLFSGISGSATADTAALGSIFIPAMREEGYDTGFSAAITGASALVGPIIPPSIILVIYGAMTGTSVGGLFAAAIVPGILLGLLLAGTVGYMSYTRDFPKYQGSIERNEYPKLTFHAVVTATMPAIILIGILMGYFTPTEAAAVASVYAVILGVIVYELDLQGIYDSIHISALRTAQIYIIIGFATILSYVLALNGVPALLAETLLGLGVGTIMFLLLISILLLFIGTWLEGAAAIILLAPTLAETALVVGINEFQFGVIFTLVVNFGLITPPIGIVLFVAASVAEIPVWDIVRKILPFYLINMLFIIVLILFPELTTFLPEYFGYM